MKTQIMFIEKKDDVTGGVARIGRVKFSKSGRSVYYQGRTLQRFKGGHKANHFDTETGEEYWISACKKDGGDRLYCGTVKIDDDAREEYWVSIRKVPENKDRRLIRGTGKYTR